MAPGQEVQRMTGERHLGRWLVIALVTLLAIAAGAFLALRPLTRMRPAHLAPRADDEVTLEPATDAASADTPPGSVPGNGSATAPEGYPVKANKRSNIYHLPGDLAYERTIPTLFFRDAEAAEAAGFRHALR
jgi:hypothetical protein